MSSKKGASDDSDDEDYASKSKSITKKSPTSNKRKRGFEED